MFRMTMAVAAAVTLAAGASQAQAPAAPSVVRGTVTALDAGSMTVKGQKGVTKVNLAPQWTVAVLKPVTPDAIKPGSFIGTAEMPQKDGTGRSLEVHVFPPGVKMGEGHYGWDLRKGSMMTNGTVGTVVAGRKGTRQLEVSYSYGKRTINVPANVPIVQITPGQRSQVKVGTPVFMVVQKTANGQLMAGSVSIGENGAKPPM
ncbi:MAG: hypothetical protein JNK30_17085 [Phenylobacterium sp.]|uniref:hypothetical protein n=1 Tax=Phenylobacterium sp. TaxID=1871053 RepID=UPI001A5BD0CE|nr:hypothetical protein [Phenylobacterium sp.]MBL8773100.1 hypothetical protein [Phenylobacterium sp.]